MKKFSSFLKVLIILFAAVFLLNIFVMQMFFEINILNPSINEPRIKDPGTGNKEDPGHKADAVREEAREETAYGESGEDPAHSEGNHSDDYYMTSDEVTNLKNLGLTDKLSALGMLAKLGGDETDELYNISLDGITYEEYEEIKSKIEDKLTAYEVSKLKEILEKNKALLAQNENK